MNDSSLKSESGLKLGSEGKRMDDSFLKLDLLHIENLGIEGTFSKGCQFLRCSTPRSRLVLSPSPYPLLFLARSDYVNLSDSFRPYSYRTSLATYPLTAC